MKTKTTYAIAGIILAGAVIFSVASIDSPSKPSRAPIAGVSQKAFRIQKPAASAPAGHQTVESETTVESEFDEEANLAGWTQRFDALLVEHGSRQKAIEVLLAEVDSVFGKWVDDQIAPLAELPPIERYDRLAIIETSVREGAAAVLEWLGVEGSRHVTVAAGAMESVSAEIQYAESAPDHGSRLAMLRLDRERENRLEQVLAITDETAKTDAMGELDLWYDNGLAQVFQDGEIR